MGSYAVNYPASDDFVASTAAGANDASTHVQSTVQNCPGTKIVLAGYSQGAAVIDVIAAAPVPGLGFTNPMPPGTSDHVAALAVLGNPSNRIGRALTDLAPVYGPKAIDLCNVGDPVCSDGNDIAAHSQYVQAGLVRQAAAFIAGRV